MVPCPHVSKKISVFPKYYHTCNPQLSHCARILVHLSSAGEMQLALCSPGDGAEFPCIKHKHLKACDVGRSDLAPSAPAFPSLGLLRTESCWEEGPDELGSPNGTDAGKGHLEIERKRAKNMTVVPTLVMKKLCTNT